MWQVVCPEIEEPSKVLKIRGFDLRIRTMLYLIDIFSKFGAIAVYTEIDDTNDPFAIVHFKSVEEAQKALDTAWKSRQGGPERD